MTVHSTESWPTFTDIRTGEVAAQSSVDTRTRATLIDIELTVASSKPMHAGAHVVVEQVEACPPVLTRFGETVVWIVIAVSSFVARYAAADV